MLPIEGLESRTADVRNIRLHYWVGGPADGQQVVLLHGFLTTGYSWRKVASTLVSYGFRVWVPDLRGYGDSAKPDGTDGYDADSLYEDCRALLKAAGSTTGRQTIVAAHDMGVLPATIWAARHPEEVAALLYIEAPVMLGALLQQTITYTPEAMRNGSMWWWILPLAPGVPERLVVGNERAFLTWFYENAAVHPEVFTDEVVEEYLRTFRGKDGVLGAMGIYRAAFTSISQTEPLREHQVMVPVVAIGGAGGLGSTVAESVRLIAADVTAVVLDDCGHFVPEEQPDSVVGWIRTQATRMLHPS